MAQLIPPQPELQKDRYGVAHRKNAVEWLLYVVLLPFVPIVWALERVKRL
ncbi:MAG TPA: hypothetical protein VGR35_02240 [Tepidisphaeraceae bacterium]|nr:hypothetical protein [Tepidisphaeraceae bacterium]